MTTGNLLLQIENVVPVHNIARVITAKVPVVVCFRNKQIVIHHFIGEVAWKWKMKSKRKLIKVSIEFINLANFNLCMMIFELTN